MTSGLARRESIMADLREVQFSFDLDGESVPGLLYLPNEPQGLLPLVLIQHPGMGSKEDYFVTEPARAWARRGWACAGIDAPLHGDRATHDPMAIFRDRSRYPAVLAQFASELSATIDHLVAEYPVDLSRLGFVGFSLGSMLGVRAVARDGRFKAAAFCLVGEGGLVGEVQGPESVVAGMDGVAVRIVGKTGDELIPRAATEALYDALPGPKDIVWLPGGHFEIGPDVIRAASDWLRDHL